MIIARAARMARPAIGRIWKDAPSTKARVIEVPIQTLVGRTLISGGSVKVTKSRVRCNSPRLSAGPSIRRVSPKASFTSLKSRLRFWPMAVNRQHVDPVVAAESDRLHRAADQP